MKKWLKWALISIAALLVVMVVLTIISTKGTIFTGGVPFGGVTFTSGDILDMPLYPGAQQSTDSSGVSIPDDMTRPIGSDEAKWKRYLTDDSPDEVRDWYQQELTDAGFSEPSHRESGADIYPEGDVRYGVYVMELDGQTNIILAVGNE